jgi:putative transposase
VDDRRHAIALFRYSLVREAADPALTTRQRGALVRQLAERDHLGPTGERVRVSRNTLDRWIRAWRAGGFQALLPADRSVAQLRSPLELLELAAALKREAPMRTSAQITQILRPPTPTSRSPRRRRFAATSTASACTWAWRSAPRPSAVSRPQRPTSCGPGMRCTGPASPGARPTCFAFIDDHSRAIVGHRWGFAEDTVRLAAALRPALAARGIPAYVYVAGLGTG